MKGRQFFHTCLIILFFIISSNSLIAQTILFSDDFESGLGNWTVTGTFGLSSLESNSSGNSLTESPSGNYSNMQKMTATINSGINLSTYLGAEISFFAKYNIEAAFDFMYLEISNDGGNTYSIIDEFTDVSSDWTKYTYNMGSFAGYSNVVVRFRFFSDHYVNEDGMYIDDVDIKGFSTDDAAPLIVHDGPVFYEGTLADFQVDANIWDVSGISSTKLYYYLDDVGPYLVDGSNIGGDNYRFIIPSQLTGVNVKYKISSTDNAVPNNTTDTSSIPFNEYISGEYLSYDDGVVDAVATVSGSKAVAVKISIPDGEYGFLRSALIRNYLDNNRTNDEMLFHVWSNNNGIPGSDLITPFLVTSEATLDNPFPFTRIDLRGYSPQLDDLTGDFFIGFTVPENSVSIIVSNNSSGRSYSYDGSSWSSYSKDYEFRAIVDLNSDPLPVELTTFNAEVNNGLVSLLWETATEINNYGFEIERKKQLESSENQDWESIGFVKGNGNSNSPKYYLYDDNSEKSVGNYYYRLKQIDVDGKFEYSDEIEVFIEASNNFSLEQNYPNPFNPVTKIKYSIPSSNSQNFANQVILKVYDILGKELVTLVNKRQFAGTYEVEFDASRYPSGLYFYTISVDEFSKSKKMMLVK